ncbi:hypothetical protein BDB00DRAFT_930822 [Zychaea mexicana]|uniref:uncharacterized protein n=1 Tax=Zychaea mexicana TaxID=64656 RepID=UPI0022FF0F90|nr:uncharacterized protein BDB00DRAFT_930822 [Zychaea mexicana]KAI9490974.1 hypothetical protein BDB00DRAFT_930822 [Zychaea mexicana]
MAVPEKEMIFAITNVDSLVGYAQAFFFLKHLDKEKHNIKLRLFCRSREELQELEKMGGESIETNYMDHHEIEKGLKDVSYLMFIPEYSSDRFQQGYNVLNAAKKQQVDYVAMFSILGVDHATKYGDYPNLNTYYRLEQIMCNEFNSEHYTVFRLPMFYSAFYGLMPMVQRENKLRMTIKKGVRFAMIDLGDCIEAIYNLSFEKGEDDDEEQQEQQEQQQDDNRFFLWRILFPARQNHHHRQQQQQQQQEQQQQNPVMLKKNITLFEFTPSDRCLTGEEMAQHMAQGLDREHLEYEEISPDDMRGYLDSIRQDERFRRGHRENEHLFPVGSFIREKVIETLLECSRLASQGLTDKVTQDLEHALHHQPMTLLDFFRKNRENFRHLQ